MISLAFVIKGKRYSILKASAKKQNVKCISRGFFFSAGNIMSPYIWKLQGKKVFIFLKYYFTRVIRVIVAIYIALSVFWELLFVKSILRNDGLEVGWWAHRHWQSYFKKNQLRHQASVLWFRPHPWAPFEYLKTKMLKEKYLFLQGIKSVWITTLSDQGLFSWSMSAVCCQWGNSTRNFSIFKIRGCRIEDIYSLKVDSSIDHHFSSLSLLGQ